MKKKSSKKPTGIKLGDLVKDLITGFSGIASSRTEHLFGCVHIGITSTGLDKDGIPVGAVSFDAQRVVRVDQRNVVVSPDSTATSGGPVPGTSVRMG
jgi:hypothetical protein